ncbi:MAG: nicotinamide riboside transporter PnuC [Tannerellaceae bacterium]|jgi:nicotinamide mononucleotide transporter|nr:nicotinamide riboside transporter PnuC [Tannerellaceae bacterium]
MNEIVLEYFGVATGLLYLFLEIKQHRAMWVVGIVSSLVYVYVFFVSKVYATMGLNLYNVLISVYGLWQWSRRRQSQDGEALGVETVLYKRLTRKLAGILSLSLGLVFVFIYYVLSRYTDSPVPVGDAVITTIGIVATWMLARRIIEHWFFWIVADALSIYIYYTLALYPTMFLYLCYTILAFAGYYTWKKKGVTDVAAL